MTPEQARKLRRAAAKVERSLEQRDQLVLDAVSSGASLREVGGLVGLTHTGVRDIVRRKGGTPLDNRTEGELP